MHRQIGSVLLLCFGLCVSAVSADSESPAVRFVDVSDGVFAALQPHETRFDDSNVLVVEGRRAVLIVDAPISRRAIDAIVEEIRRRTDVPVRYVVNTHWHGDHTQGNELYRKAFGDGVTFVGHHSLRQEIPERAAADIRKRIEQYDSMIPEAERQLAKGLGLRGQELTEEQQVQQAAAIEQARGWLKDNRDVEFVVPQLTYEERLELDLGGLHVQLLHQRAHTSGDTVVWIPERALIATGDMLDELPYVGHGHPLSWVGALESLRALPFETVVPGHGPVFKGKDRLNRALAYLQALVEHAETADEGATFDAAPWRTRLAGEDAGARRFFDVVLDEAVTRAREEAAAR